MKDIKKNQRQILEPKVIKIKHSLDSTDANLKLHVEGWWPGINFNTVGMCLCHFCDVTLPLFS